MEQKEFREESSPLEQLPKDLEACDVPGAQDIQPLQASEQTVVKSSGRARKTALRAALVLALLAAVFAGLFYSNNFRFYLELTGEEEYLLEYGEDYQEPGVRPVLTGKWLFVNGYSPEKIPVQITADIQQDRLGRYTVDYSAEFLFWSASAQRSVRVVDTQPPVITLVDTDYSVVPGQPYEEEGFTAIDNYDGDISDHVHASEEDGIVTYVVMDSSGNLAYAEREIPYFDPEAPVITLTGGENLTLTCGTIYAEPGFAASDNVDGDLTAEVAVEGEVLWYQPGTYEVVYTVADLFGNVTQKIRTVEIQGVARPEVKWPNGKVIYLTFDDGPGPSTNQLLDLLKRYGVKATFFVTGSGSSGELWRMYTEGHGIGMHTMSHDYDSIYASPEAFFTDLYAIQDVIYRNIGVRPTLMRFPGGGSNMVSSYNEGIMSILTEAVQDAGFQYFDWNVDSKDAGGAKTADEVYRNVINGVKYNSASIVLQHDIHGYSVDAVERIIQWGLANGYTFEALTPSSPTAHHPINN